MKHFEVTLEFPTGGVAIGGYSPVPDGLHASHAADRHGRPIIPATALRGALRETFESLLRGAGERACSGGDGVDPSLERPQAALPTCTLDEGRRCKACRLFGSRRDTLDPGERDFSALVLGDAELDAQASPQTGAAGWTTRPGVGISRARRSAEEQRLFLTRTPATPGLRFIARGRLLEPELASYLQAAAGATKHLGGGRSRGLARVEIQTCWGERDRRAVPTLPTKGDLRLRLTLRSPASIGAPVVHPDLRETRYEFPGAALRGAIGFSLAEVLPSPDGDKEFQALVAEDGARFGFLYPVDGEGAEGELSAPLPITAVACKRAGRAHGIADALLDRLAVALAENVEQAAAVEQDFLAECPVCAQPLRTPSGWRRRSAPVPTRTVTRVSMDRAHASAHEGHLFSQVLLEAGTSFEGVIRDIPASGRSHLARALSLPLSLGRGRSSGWGLVEVEVLPPTPLLPLEQRASNFQRALHARLSAAGISSAGADRLVPVTLLSPLHAGAQDDGEALLSNLLRGERCLFKARRFSREGGWEQRSRGMQPAIATAAGGVFVIELPPGKTWRDARDRIEQLEQRGIGDRRHQGYGQAIAFDPMFLQRFSRKVNHGSRR